MDTLDDYCRDWTEQIQAAYDKSGNRHGWRLLYSPKEVLDGAEVAFIGLNPAGSPPRDTAYFTVERGSAFVEERWEKSNQQSTQEEAKERFPEGEAPLQKQVCALFRKLHVNSAPVKPECVLAGNLIPFHEPKWSNVQDRRSAIQFGEKMWKSMLLRAQPRLVIGMGKDVLCPLRRIFKARIPQSVLVNWGNIRGHRVRLAGGGLLVVLPHLSRFSIIDRPESADALRDLFGEYWRG